MDELGHGKKLMDTSLEDALNRISKVIERQGVCPSCFNMYLLQSLARAHMLALGAPDEQVEIRLSLIEAVISGEAEVHATRGSSGNDTYH